MMATNSMGLSCDSMKGKIEEYPWTVWIEWMLVWSPVDRSLKTLFMTSPNTVFMRTTVQAMTLKQPRMVGNDCNSGSNSMALPERASERVTDFKIHRGLSAPTSIPLHNLLLEFNKNFSFQKNFLLDSDQMKKLVTCPNLSLTGNWLDD